MALARGLTILVLVGDPNSHFLQSEPEIYRGIPKVGKTSFYWLPHPRPPAKVSALIADLSAVFIGLIATYLAGNIFLLLSFHNRLHLRMKTVLVLAGFYSVSVFCAPNWKTPFSNGFAERLSKIDTISTFLSKCSSDHPKFYEGMANGLKKVAPMRVAAAKKSYPDVSDAIFTLTTDISNGVVLYHECVHLYDIKDVLDFNKTNPGKKYSQPDEVEYLNLDNSTFTKVSFKSSDYPDPILNLEKIKEVDLAFFNEAKGRDTLTPQAKKFLQRNYKLPEPIENYIVKKKQSLRILLSELNAYTHQLQFLFLVKPTEKCFPADYGVSPGRIAGIIADYGQVLAGLKPIGKPFNSSILSMIRDRGSDLARLQSSSLQGHCYWSEDFADEAYYWNVRYMEFLQKSLVK